MINFKRMKSIGVVLLLVAAREMAWGATAVSTPSAIPKPKPVMTTQSQVGSAGANASDQATVHLLIMRFRQVMIQIQKAHKSKALTDAQAQDLRTQVMDIRKQEMADMKQNGGRTLTEAQASALNGQLDKVTNSIH